MIWCIMREVEYREDCAYPFRNFYHISFVLGICFPVYGFLAILNSLFYITLIEDLFHKFYYGVCLVFCFVLCFCNIFLSTHFICH